MVARRRLAAGRRASRRYFFPLTPAVDATACPRRIAVSRVSASMPVSSSVTLPSFGGWTMRLAPAAVCLMGRLASGVDDSPDELELVVEASGGSFGFFFAFLGVDLDFG